MSDAPEISTKVTLSGSDEIEAYFERMRRSAETSFEQVDRSAKRASSSVEGGIKSVSATSDGAVRTSGEQVGILTRVAQALGDTAGYVAGKVASIATGAALAGAGLAAVVAVGYTALSGLSQASAREGEELLQLSKSSGVGVEALTRYQFAADIAAGSSDNVAGAFKRVSDALIKFQDTGDEASLGLFKQVGLDKEVESGKLKTAEQVFERLGEQLKKIPDEARRSKAAFDLLGSGAKDLLPVFSKSTAELKALQAEAKELGETKTSDLTDNTKRLEDIRRLNAAFASVKSTIVDAFFPFVADGSDKIAAWINSKSEAIESFAEGAAATVTTLFNDVTRLFNAPLTERVTSLSVDGKEIDLSKERLRNLVAIGREAGETMKEVSDDADEDAEDSAMRRIDLDEHELESFIKVGNQKIVYDENLHKKFVEIDGARVEVSKSNGGKILAYFADAVNGALDSVTSQDAKAMRFSSGFIAALYEPAQELRRLGLDMWDALSGKGMGGRSNTVRAIGEAFLSVQRYVTSTRDAILAVFGLTIADVPTFSQALRAVQRTYESFRAGLTGEDGKAPKVAWAAAVGDALRQVGRALVATWDIAVQVGGIIGPYLSAGFTVAADAFRALRDVFREGEIAPENTFAWLNRFLPDAKAAFDAVSTAVSKLYGFVRAEVSRALEGITWEGFKAGVAQAWADVVAAASKGYEKVKAVVEMFISILDRVAKALGLRDWKELGIVLLVAWLTAKVADLVGLGDVFSYIGAKIEKGLIIAAILCLALFTALASAVGGLFAVGATAGAGIIVALAAIGVAAYVYRDKIKDALGGAADWVKDKWAGVSKWFTGELLPAFGIGKKAVPEADVPMPAQGAEPPKYVPPSSGQIVLAPGQLDRPEQDREWIEEEDDTARSGYGAKRAADTARAKAEYEAMRESRIRDYADAINARLSDGKREGEVGAERVQPGMAQMSFKDFANSLQAMRGGLTQSTPFAEAPLAVPKAGAANLVPFAPTFEAKDSELYGTEAGIENVMEKLAAAGIRVKTNRPRTM